MKKIIAFFLIVLTFSFISIPSVSAQARSFKQAVSLSSATSGLYTELRVPVHQFTVETWLKFKPFTSDQSAYYIFTNRDNYGGLETSMYLSGNKNYNNGKAWLQTVVWGTMPYNLVSPVMLEPDVWYHIALVKTQTSYIVYLNGQNVISQEYTGNITYGNQAGMTIGGWPAGIWGDPYFQYADVLSAYLDEFRVSNYARYTGNFIPRTAPYTNDTNTLALYRFDRNLTDSSGHGYSLFSMPGYFIQYSKISVLK